MPRKNPRFTVALPEELLDAVVDYQLDGKREKRWGTADFSILESVKRS